MKKLSYILLLTAFPILFGCAKNDSVSTDSDIIDKVTFTVEDIGVQDTTKIYLDDNNNFIWSVTDTVGIYPNTGNQIAFGVGDGAGTSSITFDGGGWAFKASALYYSYYPFKAGTYLDRHKIPVDFTTQKQISATGRDHISSCWYMYTPAVSATSGKLNFKYKHLCCMIRARVVLPAGTYKKVTITAPSKLFVTKGYFDLQSENPEIVGTEFSDKLTLDLEDVSFTQQTEFRAVFVSAPVDLSGKEIIISVFDDQGREVRCTKTPSKPYVKGNIYNLGCEVWTDVVSTLTFKHSELKINAPQLGTVNGTIDWGDGESEPYSPSLTHNYADNSEKTITVEWKDGWDGGVAFEIAEIGTISEIELEVTE